jgi:hypothetical protein
MLIVVAFSGDFDLFIDSKHTSAHVQTPPPTLKML